MNKEKQEMVRVAVRTRSEEGLVSNGKDLCFIQNEMVTEE